MFNFSPDVIASFDALADRLEQSAIEMERLREDMAKSHKKHIANLDDVLANLGALS